jgi:hypothetical protein
MKNWTRELVKMGACKEAILWGKGFPSLKEAWAVCERGDWMIWYAGKLSGEPGSEARKKLVLAACQCARLALKYVRAGETRPLKAILTAESWARGENGVTLGDVRKAADAAAYAAAAYAANAANAAAYAASAANAYAYAAADAADAAYAAAYAAYAAADAADAAYAARKPTLKKCADIVRKFYPTAPEGG